MLIEQNANVRIDRGMLEAGPRPRLHFCEEDMQMVRQAAERAAGKNMQLKYECEVLFQEEFNDDKALRDHIRKLAKAPQLRPPGLEKIALEKGMPVEAVLKDLFLQVSECHKNTNFFKHCSPTGIVKRYPRIADLDFSAPIEDKELSWESPDVLQWAFP